MQKSQTRGGAAPVVTTYSYNRLDQLTAETTAGSTISYRYDGRGNLVEKKTPSQTVTYSWSSDNRLTQASNGSVTVKYGYDAQGRRISRTQEEGGQTEETQYLLDTARPYSEIVLERTRTNGGTWQQTMHVHTPDGVGLQLSQSSNGQAQNLYADAQGSTRLVTDHQGQTLQVLHFDAFGVEHDANPSSDIRHRYTGEAFDQTTGLYHLRARDYDPYTGRFISMDEHPGSQRIPLTLNKYLYGNADPVNTIDPSGYFGLGGVSISMGNMATLAMRALTLYDLFSSADEVGESLGLFGALLVSSVGGPAGFDAMTQDEVAIGLIMAFMPGPDKHHTIPIYMCGAKKQEYAHIDFSDHSSIHKKLYAGVLGINIVSKHYVDRYLKKPGKGGRQSTDPIVLLTKKKMGRDVLANFLRYFYQVNGYYGLTNKNNLSSHRSLGAVYEAEARKFTANNNTSHPSCKR